jgi:hypothetical protein
MHSTSNELSPEVLVSNEIVEVILPVHVILLINLVFDPYFHSVYYQFIEAAGGHLFRSLGTYFSLIYSSKYEQKNLSF